MFSSPVKADFFPVGKGRDIIYNPINCKVSGKFVIENIDNKRLISIDYGLKGGYILKTKSEISKSLFHERKKVRMNTLKFTDNLVDIPDVDLEFPVDSVDLPSTCHKLGASGQNKNYISVNYSILLTLHYRTAVFGQHKKLHFEFPVLYQAGSYNNRKKDVIIKYFHSNPEVMRYISVPGHGCDSGIRIPKPLPESIDYTSLGSDIKVQEFSVNAAIYLKDKFFINEPLQNLISDLTIYFKGLKEDSDFCFLLKSISIKIRKDFVFNIDSDDIQFSNEVDLVCFTMCNNYRFKFDETKAAWYHRCLLRDERTVLDRIPSPTFFCNYELPGHFKLTNTLIFYVDITSDLIHHLITKTIRIYTNIVPDLKIDIIPKTDKNIERSLEAGTKEDNQKNAPPAYIA